MSLIPPQNTAPQFLKEKNEVPKELKLSFLKVGIKAWLIFLSLKTFSNENCSYSNVTSMTF